MTMERKKVPPRIAAWAVVLSEFRYKIEHRKGTKMRHVDALSRYPVVMAVGSEVLEQIRLAQMNDEKLDMIRELLAVGPYKNFVIKKGVVFKANDGGEELLCVPSSMQHEIIRKVHLLGHFGVRKMRDLIEREYFIPDLASKCELVRRNCVECILSERKRGKQEGFLHVIPKGEQPLTTIHLDHIGPFTSTNKNYKYVLSLVDGFSKFVWLYPVKSLTTQEVLQKLEVHKTIFGNPRYFITDKGTAFTSSEFEKYCEENNVDHLKITTGVPRGNGQIERINEIILPALTKLSLDKPGDWYKHTSKLQRFLNSSWQRTIRRTPFEVMFGGRMRNKEECIIADVIGEHLITEFMEDREELRAEVRASIDKAQQEYKRDFDKRRKKATMYKIGDLVAIKRTQFATGMKLHPKFLGPYKVVKVKDCERYDVIKIGEHEGPITTSSSADNMKPWSENTAVGKNLDELISDDEDVSDHS